MSRWNDQFEKHALHNTLRDALGLLGEDFKDMTEEEHIERRRLSKIISLFEDALSVIDPEITPITLLDQMNNSIRHPNIWNQLNSYNSNKNHQHLVHVNNGFTNTLTDFSQLLAVSKKMEINEPLKGLERSVDEFAAAIDKKKKELIENVEGIKSSVLTQQKQLNDLSNSIDSKKKETDTLISSWQEQHSNAQDKRNSDFASDQKSRVDAFTAWKSDVEKDAEQQIEKLLKVSTEKLISEQNDFDGKISKFIENAENKHEAILELYELVAGDSVASGYLQNAENEKDQANFWRWATIVFIVLTAGWTAVSYFTGNTVSAEGAILWSQIVKAFSVTAVLLFGAAYSAKQSNAHRSNESKTRWFALEVKAIDPFISSLSDDDRRTLKTKLSERLFGQQNNGFENEGSILDEHAFGVLVKGITDILKSSKQ